jgi:DNA-binding NarL/FixJ family response regulator
MPRTSKPHKRKPDESGSEDKLRILVVDDHPVVREGLMLLLNDQADMEVVGYAGDGKLAVEMACQLQPNVIVMDLSLPGLPGDQATEILNRDYPDLNLKVLILTAHEEAIDLDHLMKAGALGVVLKRAAPNELVHALRTVGRGGVYLDPTLMSRLVVQTRSGQTAAPADTAELSDREAEVLKLIAAGYTHRNIAAELHISAKTVETYRSRLMQKLNLHSRAEMVRYALLKGLLDLHLLLLYLHLSSNGA